MSLSLRLACKSLFLACLLFGSLAAQAQTLSLEAGTDRMGGDYKGFETSDDPVLCQRACAADDNCKAFTFVRPGLKGPRAMCFLKSSVPRPTADACCTSGARVGGAAPAARSAPTPTARPALSVRQARVMPTPAPAQSEPPSLMTPPYAVRASSDLGNHIVAWQWSQHACFPAAAGAEPKPCPFVQGLDGFRIYRLDGSLAGTATDPSRREFALGVQPGGNCYTVSAFKGEFESAPSAAGCIDNPPPPPPISAALPVPANLHATTDPKECAAATGGAGFGGLICDAAMKNNAQPLIWELQGGGIDGFRVYDAYQGTPVLVKSEANAKLRVFMIEPTKGVVVNDSCYTVRSYKGEFESLPSNPVCLTPKGLPQKPLLLIAPSSGLGVQGVELLKNQNSGCPFKTHHADARIQVPFEGTLVAGYVHRDYDSLCGHRLVVWDESSVMFPLDAVPADFVGAHLKFTAGGSSAQLGTEAGSHATDNPVTLGANCTQGVYSYYVTLLDNAQVPDRYGAPGAFFAWLKQALVATAVDNAPGAVNSIDVTALVKKAKAAGKPGLGFVFTVDRSMHADMDMCMASFHSVVLEIRPKP